MRVTPPNPAPVVNYAWDNNGNVTAKGSDSFSWDFEDRMMLTATPNAWPPWRGCLWPAAATSATVGGTTTTFAYRGDGLRNSRTTGGVTTTFTWDIASGLPVVIDDGSQCAEGKLRLPVLTTRYSGLGAELIRRQLPVPSTGTQGTAQVLKLAGANSWISKWIDTQIGPGRAG